MFKQRDNEYHPPMMVDPSGTGSGMTAVAGRFGDTGNDQSLEGPAVAAGSRKRGRDIRGINRFRTVVYGEDGFRRLHAMVARNPTLMYPPDGIDAARARVAARRAELTSATAGTGAQAQPEEDDVFALFEARHRAEAAQAAPAHDEEAEAEAHPPASSLAALRQDEELATYHHKQLDTYLRQLYEFNHVTFVKLPMEDTLQLLSRCGKEALAHVVEFETQLRLQRQSRIRDLNELREEQAELEERRRAMEAEEQARLLVAAEQRQAELELELSNAAATASGVTEAMPVAVVKPEMLDEDNEEEQKLILVDSTTPAVTAQQPSPPPHGPSVHFADYAPFS